MRYRKTPFIPNLFINLIRGKNIEEQFQKHKKKKTFIIRKNRKIFEI
jgi:hypothetical protein